MGYVGPNNETERPEIIGSPREENQNIGKLAKTGSERFISSKGRLVISRGTLSASRPLLLELRKEYFPKEKEQRISEKQKE
jgi:hypothetical protein